MYDCRWTVRIVCMDGDIAEYTVVTRSLTGLKQHLSRKTGMSRWRPVEEAGTTLVMENERFLAQAVCVREV